LPDPNGFVADLVQRPAFRSSTSAALTSPRTLLLDVMAGARDAAP